MAEKIIAIVAGSRDFIDEEFAHDALSKIFKRYKAGEVTICDGGARGADRFGRNFAKSKGFHVRDFPADWDNLGKAAGFIRNEEMAKAAGFLVAFWDGKSHGTKDMIERAMKHGLRVITIILKPEQMRKRENEQRERNSVYPRPSGKASTWKPKYGQNGKGASWPDRRKVRGTDASVRSGN